MKPRMEAGSDIRVLLEEIEKEDVPERLLELAKELQAALAARSRTDSSDCDK